MSKARSPRSVVSMTMGTVYSLMPGLLAIMQPVGCEYSATLGLHKEEPMHPRARVEKRIVYPVGREEVWSALTRAEELSRWLGMEVVSFDLRPAGRIVFRDAGGTSRRALIEEGEGPGRVAFRGDPPPGAGAA